MKNKVDSIKFANGPKGNQYVVVFSTDVVTKLLAGDVNTIELLQRSLKNADKDEWREFASKDDNEESTANTEQSTIDSLVPVDIVVPDLSTATVVVEETPSNFTY